MKVATGPIPARTRFRRHAHEGLHVCCVLEGGFVESQRGGWEDVGPGTVRLSPSSRHDIEFAPTGARCLVISLETAEELLVPVPARSVYLRDPWLDGLVGRLGRAATRRETAAAIAFEELLDELLAQIARRRGVRAYRQPPAWLETARVRVRRAGGRAPLGELASRLGVHRAHLARAFKDHYGTTIGTYARRLRVQRAVALLEDHERTLAEIADLSGFADQSHMTRAVSAAMGLPPGKLRQHATPVQDGGGADGLASLA